MKKIITISITDIYKEVVSYRKKLLFTLLVLFLISQMVLTAQITYSFSTAGATGPQGPTQSQLNTAYGSTNLNGLVTSNAGIQTWTVPYTGLFKIEAGGASGGNQGTQPFGTGATLSGEFLLSAGQVIKIVVGQNGVDSPISPNASWEGAGGGGGTYVVLNSGNSPLIVAAGGSGGDGYGNYTSRNKPGGSSSTGNASTQGLANSPTASSAGGGFTYNGQNGNSASGGVSFVNGSTGGICTYGASLSHGGFGGGGAGDYYSMGGAGGGYQGGSSTGGYNNTNGLTSAFSYNNGGNQVNTSGVTTSSISLKLNGYVKITSLFYASISQTSSISCNGLTTAALSANVSGGSSPYTYSWAPSGGTSTSVSGLGAGIYTLTVTDAGSLTTSNTYTVTQPAVLAASISSQTNISCFSGSNGAVVVAPTGGTAPYSYTWSPSGGNAASATNLTAGVYTVTIKDANNCATILRTATITQPSALATTTVVTNVLCNGGNGSATITTSGGTGAYTYLWSNGATTSVVSSVVAGAYTSTVTDAHSCTSTKSVVITQPSALATSTAVTNVPCNSGNGSATITASGGTSPYTYLWSNGATTSVVSGVLAGAYTSTVTDANSCTSIKSFTITQPSALVTSTAVTNVSCNGGTGSATLTASGGTGAYTYLWSNATTNSVVSGVVAGAYTGTVTDANNCTSIKSVTIMQPSALVTSTVVTNVSCNGGTGSATLTVSGGTGSYTYLWSNAATGSVITGVVAGAYTSTVTDANSCTSTKSLIITQPSALVTSTTVTNVLCNGGNGSATLTASGGAGSYTYLWSNGATTSVISGVVAGAYTSTVTDANSCTSTKSFIITQPSALVTSTAVTNVLCNGGNGSATITASGGTGAYTYLWSNAATSSVVSISAGIYTATVTDANSCTSSKTLTATQPSALVTTTTGINALCNGGNGSGTITASGGTGTYTYLWSNAATGSVITSVLAGAYTATVTDANNCTSTKSVNITQPSPLVVSISSQSNVTCNSGSNGSASVVATGGTGPYTYTWTPTGGNTSTVSGLSAGAYSVTVKDFNNCAIVQQTITITQPATFSVSANASSLTICYGASVTLNGSGGTAYVWTGGITDGSAFSPSSTTSYSVTGTNSAGCLSANVATLTITVNSLPSITVNNGFVCSGQAFTITPSGASTYTYSNGSNTVIPTVNTSYSVTGTDSLGCVSSNTAVSSVTVNALPTVIISGTNAICAGDSTTLSVSGASVYLWSTSANSTTIVVNPATTSTYSVAGTDANGCMNTAMQTLSVNTLPVISILSSSTTICLGETTSLTVTGGVIYSWSTGQTNTVIAVQPTVTSTYTVMGFDVNGCMNTASVTQSVSACTGLAVIGMTHANISIYPNPNTGNFTITGISGGQFKIINEVGQTVKILSLNETNNYQASVNELPNGIYFVIGNENNTTISKKIIVNK